jgi:hypothetical protein
LGFTPLGYIPCYFDKAKQFTVLISNGIKDGKRPELRTVFAKTPAFALESTLRCGNIQRNFWNALLSILWRKKLGKVLPNDFALLVPLQAAGAWIPANDEALGANQVQRVINNSMDEQVQPPLTYGMLSIVFFSGKVRSR